LADLSRGLGSGTASGRAGACTSHGSENEGAVVGSGKGGSLRILLCNYEYPPLGGGGGVATLLLAEELAQRHPVTVLTSQGSGLAREETRNAVRIVRVPVGRKHRATASLPSMFGYMLMGSWVGRRLVAAERYDVINTHFALPSGPVGDALSRRGIPNVLSVHGGDLYDPSKWSSPHRHPVLRRWVRSLLERADAVITQSSDTLDNARRFYAPALEGEIVPLGIKRPPAAAAPRRRYGYRDDHLLLITVGRLVARKAIDQLIAVLARPELEQVHLMVVGDGPLEPELRQQAAQLRVDQRVRFFGHVSETEKFQLLRMADAFVSTSQHEGFGLVFLEAMACGLPIVCYDRGGQRDFLDSGSTGAVVPLNDRDAFVRACHRLMLDPRARQRAGAENLRRVECYLIDRCAERYEATFRKVTAARRHYAGTLDNLGRGQRLS
jgi:glycosyltransferase involved in cell wall biosynthesis